MFWDDIKLVTEQVQKYGLREPFVDLGGLEKPKIADYDLTIKTGDQHARYVSLGQRPFDHIAPNYLILNPENGDPVIEELPAKYANSFGTAVCLNVIEHVENPFKNFQAFYEMMKQNSLLIISTVFLFPYHPSPRDYWRYSPECLRYLSKEAGFKVLEGDWRLDVPPRDGGLEISSVYVTLSKEEFTASPGKIYPLPKRVSKNPTANNLIALESTKDRIDKVLQQAQKSPESPETLTNLRKARQQVAELCLDIPASQLRSLYLAELGQMHQKLQDSGVREQPLTETEWTNLKEVLDKQAESMNLPEWEYIPEGWAKKDSRIKGWNVQSILDIRKENWSSYKELLESREPVASNHGTHNTYMSYGYVLALAARKKDCVAMLDWGGGIGDYYLISKALLPEVEIDYHCKEMPLLCQAGRELLPEASFYENDEDCFKQNYDLVLASSSLQYSEDWQGVVQKLAGATRSYLYITRMPIVLRADSFVVLQRPYQYGYQTEYLGWFINRQEFLEFMNGLQMELVREFAIAEKYQVAGAPEPGEGRGFLFRPQSNGSKA